MQEDQAAQLQQEIGALKRQMRQLLEVVALVQDRQGGSSVRDSGAAAPPLALPHPETTSSAPFSRPATPAPGSSSESSHAAPGESTLVRTLLEQNQRLSELARAQAEELGVLRERLARLEAHQGQPEPMGQALSALLRALRDAG